MKRYKEQNPGKVKAYLEEIAAIPKSQIAYVDETGIDTYLYREYCWAPKGQNIIGYVSGKKYRRIGIVAAQIGNDIVAPLRYDGTMNGELFEVWFKTRLLRELPQNSVIVMDNASFHRKSRLLKLVENCELGFRIVFLPPYSPELNPIENFWAALKARLRRYLPAFAGFEQALRYSFMPV